MAGLVILGALALLQQASIADIQAELTAIFAGTPAPCTLDVNRDRTCDVRDVQAIIEAVLNRPPGCQVYVMQISNCLDDQGPNGCTPGPVQYQEMVTTC